jgi:hypothetical protein
LTVDGFARAKLASQVAVSRAFVRARESVERGEPKAK